MRNISGWSLLDGFRLARTVGKYLKNRLNYTEEEFINAAESAIKKHPHEWTVYFALGDKYQGVGRYADSLVVLKQCAELKPTDIRSAYALATGYNLMTRASWSQQEADIANRMFGLSGTKEINPSSVVEEMKKAGLTVPACAIQAVRWFKKCLTLHPDIKSKNQIQEDLKTLYARFPFVQKI